jgi:hypothetical protein
MEKTLAILGFILFPWFLWAMWMLGEWIYRKVKGKP